MKAYSILKVELRYGHDIVLTRQRARQIAALLGMDPRDQTRVATATSEIARNAFKYAGGGTVEFRTEPAAGKRQFRVVIRDQGPGIADLQGILDGRCASNTGLGLGILGTRRLMDHFQIESTPGQGTTVTLGKVIPHARPLTDKDIATLTAELARRVPEDPLWEIQEQNRELMRTLEELRLRQAELAQVNRELEDTNRGVVALYAELDDRADYLQRASELKSHFLSNMSHEFRTPLNAILSLSRLLLDRTDGDLTPEQEKQVGYIRTAAGDLSELVNDLLDLAKVEAGKISVRANQFEVANLFSALRGMLRPLLVQKSLDLTFEDPAGIPPVYSDEGKISQILRNFLSNALKYTEKGEVRVTATLGQNNDVVFAVKDTGIGIAPQDHDRIFDEWVQVDSPLQKRVKGSGLGLPLSRKLAELLGARVWVESTPGVGSTFYVSVPLAYAGPTEVSYAPEVKRERDPNRIPVLAIEDNRETLLVYEKHLRNSPFQLFSAHSLPEARQVLVDIRPAAVILDVLLEGGSSWAFLADLKADPKTKDLPVIVATVVDNRRKAMSLGATAFAVKPIERQWLLGTLSEVTGQRVTEKVLVIDDEESARYIIKNQLQRLGCEVLEADGGRSGLQAAREQQPQAIFLDLLMDDLGGFGVLDQLKADPATTRIPVIVLTSKRLSADERKRLALWSVAILGKADPPEKIVEALNNAGMILTTEHEAHHA